MKSNEKRLGTAEVAVSNLQFGDITSGSRPPRPAAVNAGIIVDGVMEALFSRLNTERYTRCKTTAALCE